MSPVDVEIDRSPVEKIPIRSTYFFYVILAQTDEMRTEIVKDN